MKNPTALSRRGFTKLLGAGAAYAALRPALGLSESTPAETKTSDVVRLSSNENPYGPSPAALKAMTAAFALAWKYPDETQEELVEALAKLNQVSKEQILPGAGSGEILKVAVAAFTGADKKLVVGDPTFEAAAGHAKASHAEVVKVKLNSSYSHDLPKMLDVPNTGLHYVCNPNNPTASITPKGELRAFLAKVPRETIVLVDEAYHHFVESADYESVIPLVKDYPNLIVARTFSKIYGMAGLRLGYCVAQPDKIELMRAQQSWDSVSIMAIVAAKASLEDAVTSRTGPEQKHGSKKIRLRRAGQDALHLHSVARELHDDRHAARSETAHCGVSRAQGPGGPALSAAAEFHARDHRDEAADGAVSGGVQGSRGIVRRN